jgi:uncharacterized membrane protein YtjA (UPF0391 family)
MEPAQPRLGKETENAVLGVVVSLDRAASRGLGFGGIAIAAASMAKILFFIFLVLFLVSLVMHVSRRT